MDHNAYVDKLRSGPIPKELPFTMEEYRQRVAKVRDGMDEAGLDVLLVTLPANLNYLTGFYTFSMDGYACLILPREGEPAMHVSFPEIGPTILCSWIEDVVSLGWNQLGEVGSQLAAMLRERGLDDKRIGIEFTRGGLTHRLSQELEAVLSRARLQDASSIVEEVRHVKSPKEIEYLREAGKITSIGINASLAAIKPGATDNDVAKVGYQAMVAAGSEFMSTQPIATSGHRSGFIHTNFRRVPLKVGDNVFLEYGGVYQRYTAPMMRTGVIGQPSDEVRRVTEAVKDTVRSIFEAARPGRTCHEVAQDAHKGYAHVEPEIFNTGIVGYNVGVGFPPSWSSGTFFIGEGVDRPLLPGMTFHLPVVFRMPGKFAVGLSETMAITETGSESLTETERDIYIVPA